jgi:hypothetical protein
MIGMVREGVARKKPWLCIRYVTSLNSTKSNNSTMNKKRGPLI